MLTTVRTTPVADSHFDTALVSASLPAVQINSSSLSWKKSSSATTEAGVVEGIGSPAPHPATVKATNKAAEAFVIKA
jgi:hypothetical protein